jgi:hypothetical protein
LRGWDFSVSNPARGPVVLVAFWFPVCLLANIFSMVLYPFSDARRLLLFRFVSLAAVLVPFAWLCVESS